MINLDSIINKNNEEHNEKWPYIPDHPYRILIIGGSASGKTHTFLNLINEQKDIDKIYLYAKDLTESKYKYLIKNRENVGVKHVNDPNAFIECSNTMDDVYENIDDCYSMRDLHMLHSMCAYYLNVFCLSLLVKPKHYMVFFCMCN